MTQVDDIDVLKRRLERERQARAEAEVILEKKALELYGANEQLKHLNGNLEQQIQAKLAELQQSEQRYRQLVESVQDIIYKISPEGIFTFVNSVVEKLLGYTEPEFIGKHFTDIVAPGYRKETFAFYQSMLLDDKDSTYNEFPVVAKDGRTVWIGQTVRSIKTEGKVTELVAVARDVSDRKVAELELQTTQIRFSALLTSLQSGILVKDEQQRVILVNQLFCDLFGIQDSPEQLIGQDHIQSTDLVKHLMEDPDEFVRQVEQRVQNREAVAGEEIRMADGRVLDRDYVPIFLKDQYMGHLWKYSDVTDKYLARERIRRSEEKYRGIMNNMELGLLEVDKNQTIIRSYERFCKMVGYTEEELVGKHAAEFLVAPEFLNVINQQQSARRQGYASSYEMQLIRKDGGRIWALVSGVPILDEEGAVVGSIGIHYDLTERKQLEEELARAKQIADEARQAEKQFLANMSHEIRTPLNAIIGMSHLLFDTKPTEQQREYIDILKTSANFLHSLISDLLDMTKIEAGRIEVHARPFDLAGLLRSIQKVFEMKLQDRQISVDVMIDARISGNFIGDDVMLNQILMNLVGNAEKFTEEGSIQITARLKKQEAAKYWIEFAVIDSGIGIPEEKLGLVFQKFRQVNPQGHKHKGTGLGLAITKELVEIQGGTISVRSHIGEGSQFTFVLPFEKSEKQPEPAAPANAPSGDELKGCCVLVVEDNLMNQKYISSLLTKWNVPYTLALNGKQAVEEAKKQRFDIILMDIQMPIMDGYEAAVAIRSTQNPSQYVPIVALTASAMLDQKNLALEAGMNDFLAKPFEPAQLRSLLQQYAPAELEHDEDDVLDWERLKLLYGSDMAYTAEMFSIFLTDIVPEIVELPTLCQEEKRTELAQKVHKLKPTFGMVGLSQLEGKMTQLEKIIKQGAKEDILQIYCNDIIVKVNEMIPVIKREVKKITPV